MDAIPSAWVEAALLREFRSELVPCAISECNRCDAEDDETHDGRVGLPVGGLCVPTTGRRPDVLGVTRPRRCVNARPMLTEASMKITLTVLCLHRPL